MTTQEEIKLLKAQIGNFEVQNSEYRQIVKELSDKLSLYESKYGTVFMPVSYTHLTLPTILRV